MNESRTNTTYYRVNSLHQMNIAKTNKKSGTKKRSDLKLVLYRYRRYRHNDLSIIITNSTKCARTAYHRVTACPPQLQQIRFRLVKIVRHLHIVSLNGMTNLINLRKLLHAPFQWGGAVLAPVTQANELDDRRLG